MCFTCHTFDRLNWTPITGDDEQSVFVDRQLDGAVEETVADHTETVATSLIAKQ